MVWSSQSSSVERKKISMMAISTYSRNSVFAMPLVANQPRKIPRYSGGRKAHRRRLTWFSNSIGLPSGRFRAIQACSACPASTLRCCTTLLQPLPEPAIQWVADKRFRTYRRVPQIHQSYNRNMARTSFTLRDFNALFAHEDAARAWSERARWPDGAACHHRDVVNEVRRMAHRGLRRRACAKPVSVTAGAPTQKTHLPLLIDRICQLQERERGVLFGLQAGGFAAKI